MKVISLIVLCLGMAVAGYFLYEGIVPLALKAPSDGENDPLIRSVTYQSDDGTEKQVQLDLHKILPTQYPETVTLNSDTNVSSEDGSLSETLPAGTVVIPRNVQDGKLIIQQKDSILRGLIDFGASDFESKLAVKTMSATPTSSQGTEKNSMASPPATQTKAQPTSKGGPLSEDQLFALMKKSLQEEQITEFKIDQVKGWKKESDETIDKQNFQVGLVVFEANTIFGTEMLKAKALIKDGTVVRWVWPRSGMDIR